MSAARDDITFYWGVASGSSHAALHRHYEGEPEYQDAPRPTHTMLSWRTENNQVWEGPTWFIDSGGAPDTIIRAGGHPDTVHDYLDYVASPPTKYGDDLADVNIQHFALRDWPCEPRVRDALNLSVEQLQHRTLVDHINTMNAYEDRPIGPEPVAVLQGFRTDQYLKSIDQYREHGLITDKIAIGTLCTRQDPTVIRDTARRVARNLPARCDIHGFGVRQPALREPNALRIFGSVDTAAWEQTIRQATKTGIEIGPPGGTYDDWVDFDGDGNPRYTARNLWISYRGYADRLSRLAPIETDHNVSVVTLDELLGGQVSGREEGYVVAKCMCGNILDPGRPEPIIGGQPGCRHCDRGALDIKIRRIGREDELQRRGEPNRRRQEPPEQDSTEEQLSLEGLKEDIRGRF